MLLAEIEELKKKRPRALTEEQKTDILVAYRSLQVENLKRKKRCVQDESVAKVISNGGLAAF